MGYTLGVFITLQRTTQQVPQGMGSAPRPPQLQECLDAEGGTVGVSVHGQGLNWMVFVGPFYLRTLHDSAMAVCSSLCF